MLNKEIVATNDTILDELVVDELKTRLHGLVIRPGDTNYDEARAIWNGMIDRQPALIARCTGPADVIEAVNFARDYDLTLSIRGGGHNVAGNAVCDGGLVIDLSLMRGIHVDPRARTVRAQGGATWSDVDRETQVFGLATPGGIVSTTGVGGLTLHGGMGHLRRKYGLSIDNLLSVDIVTADGQLRTASETENEDLFWAVRGAGSNFGVVTSFEFRLHPVGPTVMLCAPIYALDDASTIVPKWRDFVMTAPDEITSALLFWSIPPGFPEEFVGKPVVIPAAVYAGPVEDGERAMQPLREFATPVLDLSAPEPYTALQSSFDPFFPPGLLYYWKSLYGKELSDDLIDALCRFAAERPSPMSSVMIWHHGGAMHRARPEDMAFSQRDAPFMVSFDATWDAPSESDSNVAWSREAWASVQRYSSGGLYLNFPGFGEENEDLVRAAYGSNYERLVELKTKYDPANLFRMNQNIKPGQ